MPDYEGTFPAQDYLRQRETGQGSTNEPQGEGYDIQSDAAMLESLIHMQQKVRPQPEQPTATEMFEGLSETELRWLKNNVPKSYTQEHSEPSDKIHALLKQRIEELKKQN